jgi:hypothetical protein
MLLHIAEEVNNKDEKLMLVCITGRGGFFGYALTTTFTSTIRMIRNHLNKTIDIES